MPSGRTDKLARTLSYGSLYFTAVGTARGRSFNWSGRAEGADVVRFHGAVGCVIVEGFEVTRSAVGPEAVVQAVAFGLAGEAAIGVEGNHRGKDSLSSSVD